MLINNIASSSYMDTNRNNCMGSLKMYRDINSLKDRRDNNNSNTKASNPKNNSISTNKSLYKSISNNLVQHLSELFYFFLDLIRRDQLKFQQFLLFFLIKQVFINLLHLISIIINKILFFISFL